MAHPSNTDPRAGARPLLALGHGLDLSLWISTEISTLVGRSVEQAPAGAAVGVRARQHGRDTSRGAGRRAVRTLLSTHADPCAIDIAVLAIARRVVSNSITRARVFSRARS